MKLVLATRNPHKVKEIKGLFGNGSVEILSLRDFPEIPEIKEDGETLRENAIIKAREAAKKTGCLSMADDSGLEVHALGGKPGVRSARFAGEKVDYDSNNEKLLKLMRHLPREKRGACFRCVIAIARPPGGQHTKNFGVQVEVVEGKCEGEIVSQPRGANGFGYDPVFLDTASGKTFAELTFPEKNKISHRSRALSKACRILETILKEEKSG